MVEAVLFGTGRHLLLSGDPKPLKGSFERALVAWNGSREACRALGESLPYLHRSKAVTVVVVDRSVFPDTSILIGENVVSYLQHHGLTAELKNVAARDRNVSQAIMDEASATWRRSPRHGRVWSFPFEGMAGRRRTSPTI